MFATQLASLLPAIQRNLIPANAQTPPLDAIHATLQRMQFEGKIRYQQCYIRHSKSSATRFTDDIDPLPGLPPSNGVNPPYVAPP